MEVTGGGGRRRRSLSDESLDNPNLRDFLRVKQEGDESHTPSGTTLGGVLADKEPPAQTRTLLDIIRDDPTSSQHGNRKTWRVFRDKLRLKRAGAAWTSSVHVPTSDVPIPSANRMMLRRQSTRYGAAGEPEPEPESGQNPAESELAHAGTGSGPEISRSGLNSLPSSRAMMLRRNSSRMPSLANTNHGRDAEMSQTFNTARSIVQMADQNAGQQQHEEEGNHEGEEGGSEEGGEGGGSEEEEGEGEPEVRMSLMALLAETDRAMGIDGSPFIMDDDGEDEDEEEEVVSSGAGDYNNCCVCMVRHKGAAFIPCGHTFCRLCSRELWVQRGSCPLCNNFILEILDIF